MNLSPSGGRGRIAVTGATQISQPLNWKLLQQCARNRSGDFCQPLAQNFLLLCQQVRNKKDATSLQTLEAIIDSLVELTNAVEVRKSGDAPVFTSNALTIFTRLAESYNNPTVLKQAGLHYLMEWRLPAAALPLFQRALSLGGAANALQPLIEVATIAVQKKEGGNTAAPDAGITAPQAGQAQAAQIVRETDKVLITKSLRPSSHAALIARTQKIRPGEDVPGQVKEALQQAGKEVVDGNLALAEDLLRQVDKYPVKKEVMWAAWTNLGMAYYQAGQYPEMEQAYAQAYVYDPQGGNTYFNLALAKSLNQKIDEAVALYRMATQLDPTNAKTWCNLGVLHFQHDQFAEAEEAFRSALQHRPEYARAWDNLGSALVAQGKTEEAIGACHKAIELHPGYPEAYFKLSTICFDRGDATSLAEAATMLSYAVNYPPLAAPANAMLSMIHSRLEQIDSAKASLQRAVESDPKCNLLPTVWNELESAIRSS